MNDQQTAAPARPDKPTIGEAQPCPVCGYHIPTTHIVIGEPAPGENGCWTCRVRLYCEQCEGVAETWYQTRPGPWLQTGRHRWHDGKSKALRRMQRDLARRPASGVRTG